jgi:hypothetical protein
MKIKKVRPINKCVITCTDTEHKVKGVVIQKTDHVLEVELPTGFHMQLKKSPHNRKLYVCRMGMWEFVSDGWVQA